jgi:hypothetical protein
VNVLVRPTLIAKKDRIVIYTYEDLHMTLSPTNGIGLSPDPYEWEHTPHLVSQLPETESNQRVSGWRMEYDPKDADGNVGGRKIARVSDTGRIAFDEDPNDMIAEFEVYIPNPRYGSSDPKEGNSNYVSIREVFNDRLLTATNVVGGYELALDLEDVIKKEEQSFRIYRVGDPDATSPHAYRFRSAVDNDVTWLTVQSSNGQLALSEADQSTVFYLSEAIDAQYVLDPLDNGGTDGGTGGGVVVVGGNSLNTTKNRKFYANLQIKELVPDVISINNASKYTFTELPFINKNGIQEYTSRTNSTGIKEFHQPLNKLNRMSIRFANHDGTLMQDFGEHLLKFEVKYYNTTDLHST